MKKNKSVLLLGILGLVFLFGGCKEKEDSLMVQELILEDKTFVGANGGVVIFSMEAEEEYTGKTGTCYGAMDYDGTIIVEAKYPYNSKPDEQGNFVMAYQQGVTAEGNEQYALCLYDKQGQEILCEGKERGLDSVRWLAPEKGVFSYITGYYDQDGIWQEAIKVFDINQGHQIYQREIYDWEEIRLISSNETTLIYECNDIFQNTVHYSVVDLTGEKPKYEIDGYVYNEENRCSYTISPVYTPNDGYLAVKVVVGYEMGESVLDVTYFGLLDEDRSEAYFINAYALGVVKGDNYLGIRGVDGRNATEYSNTGKKIVLNGEKTDVLLDFSKLVTASPESGLDMLQGSLAEKIFVVDEFDEVLVAEYSSISMSMFGWHLIKDQNSWCYLDDKGNVVTEFEDCANFHSEYSGVVDEGIAYIINQELEKVVEICPATGVTCYGDVYRIKKGDKYQYYILKTE